MSLRTLTTTLLLALAATVLGGCATHRVVDGQVQSHSRLSTLPSPASYRIDRLPSQQAASFDAIERLADQAFARVGLQRDAAQPSLIAQIGVQAGQVPRHDPLTPYPYGWGWYYGDFESRWGMHGLWRMGGPTPLHRRAVSVVLRDARSQEVVYETSAVHEDVWVHDPTVYGLLFDAALNGFPTPPAGPRQVRVPMPSPAPR